MTGSGRFKKWCVSFLMVLSLALLSEPKAVYASRFDPGGPSCSIQDPPELTDIFCVLARVIHSLFSVIFALAMIYLIVGAIRLVTAGGDEKALDQAKKALTYAILGMIVSAGAVFIVDLVGNLIGVPELTIIKIP